MKANTLSVAPLQQLIKEIMSKNENRRSLTEGYKTKDTKIKLRKAAVLKIKKHLYDYLMCSMKSMVHIAVASGRSTIMPSDHKLQRNIASTYFSALEGNSIESFESDSLNGEDLQIDEPTTAPAGTSTPTAAPTGTSTPAAATV